MLRKSCFSVPAVQNAYELAVGIGHESASDPPGAHVVCVLFEEYVGTDRARPRFHDRFSRSIWIAVEGSPSETAEDHASRAGDDALVMPLALLPRSGAWMVWIKRAAAVIMIGMAEYYFVLAGYNL